jgi:uncharacterized protein (TIGR00297 family)
VNGLLPTSFASSHTLLLASIVTLAFSALAWWVRGVTKSGAVAGAIICFVLFIGAGPGAFVGLVAVFLLAWTSTRIGYRRKAQLGKAESKNGRKASQVMANLSIAAGCAVLHLAHPRFTAFGVEVFSLGMVAALSEAAADTVSSELGQVQRYARLITTWKSVPPGTDGGVSLLGTFSGVLSAALVAWTCLPVRLVPFHAAIVATVAATIGMLTDSLLGALLERRGVLNNDAVNFLGTLIAAAAAIFYASFSK